MKRRFAIEVVGDTDALFDNEDIVDAFSDAIELIACRLEATKSEVPGLKVWDVTEEVFPYDGLTNQERVRKIADITGGEVYNDYSGRGMNGARCMGIAFRYPSVVLNEAARAGLQPKLRQDDLGRDSIIYWPTIKPDDVE